MARLERTLRLIILLSSVILLSGCDFQGEVRSSFDPLPDKQATFSFVAEGDNPPSPELEAMLTIQLKNYGWVEQRPSGFEVHYSYDINPHVPMVELGPSPAQRISEPSDPKIPFIPLAEEQRNFRPLLLPPYIKFFKKTFRVWFVDHFTKKRGGQSRVDQVDGCADIRVSVPYLVAMAFDNFPQGHPDIARLSVSDGDRNVSEFFKKHPEWNFSTCPTN